MSTDYVLDWLSTVPDAYSKSPAVARPRKRQRIHPPTPESSQNHSDDDNPITKIPKMADSETGSPSKRSAPAGDLDETPRPPRSTKRVQTAGSESSYSLSNHSQASSGRLSPQKQIHALGLNPQGLNFEDLVLFEDMPPSLETLLEKVDTIMEGHGILSPAMRDLMISSSHEHKDLKWVRRGDAYFDASRDEVGHTPLPLDVMDVLSAAAECSRSTHPEVNWNLEVHQRVLSLAFRPRGEELFKHLVNFMGRYILPTPTQQWNQADSLQHHSSDYP